MDVAVSGFKVLLKSGEELNRCCHRVALGEGFSGSTQAGLQRFIGEPGLKTVTSHGASTEAIGIDQQQQAEVFTCGLQGAEQGASVEQPKSVGSQR